MEVRLAVGHEGTWKKPWQYAYSLNDKNYELTNAGEYARQLTANERPYYRELSTGAVTWAPPAPVGYSARRLSRDMVLRAIEDSRREIRGRLAPFAPAMNSEGPLPVPDVQAPEVGLATRVDAWRSGLVPPEAQELTERHIQTQQGEVLRATTKEQAQQTPSRTSDR